MLADLQESLREGVPWTTPSRRVVYRMYVFGDDTYILRIFSQKERPSNNIQSRNVAGTVAEFDVCVLVGWNFLEDFLDATFCDLDMMRTCKK